MANLTISGQSAALISEQLSQGIFLSASGEAPNVMTIGWGGLAFYRGKHVFVAPVRPQRFTDPLLEALGGFTTCVPQQDACDAGDSL